MTVQANHEVGEVIRARIDKKTSRRYQRYNSQVDAKIGKYASCHGVAATVCYVSFALKTLVRMFVHKTHEGTRHPSEKYLYIILSVSSLPGML